jgi:hypothetical protein
MQFELKISIKISKMKRKSRISSIFVCIFPTMDLQRRISHSEKRLKELEKLKFHFHQITTKFFAVLILCRSFIPPQATGKVHKHRNTQAQRPTFEVFQSTDRLHFSSFKCSVNTKLNLKMNVLLLSTLQLFIIFLHKSTEPNFAIIHTEKNISGAKTMRDEEKSEGEIGKK